MTGITSENIDGVMAIYRQKALALVAESERRFVDSTTARGALTVKQALRVLDEERDAVLDSIDKGLDDLRAWILRGCKDSH